MTSQDVVGVDLDRGIGILCRRRGRDALITAELTLADPLPKHLAKIPIAIAVEATCLPWRAPDGIPARQWRHFAEIDAESLEAIGEAPVVELAGTAAPTLIAASARALQEARQRARENGLTPAAAVPLPFVGLALATDGALIEGTTPTLVLRAGESAFSVHLPILDDPALWAATVTDRINQARLEHRANCTNLTVCGSDGTRFEALVARLGRIGVVAEQLTIGGVVAPAWGIAAGVALAARDFLSPREIAA
ncbi:MAG: hypothetical protein ACHREM_28220 [Polyangiales bacterium]